MPEAEARVEHPMGLLVRTAGVVTTDGTTLAEGAVTLAAADEKST